MRSLLGVLTIVLPSAGLVACSAGETNNSIASNPVSNAVSNSTPESPQPLRNGIADLQALGPSVPDRPNAGRIAIRGGTLASVYIHADSPMAARLRLPAGAAMSLGSAVTERLAQRLRAAGRDAGIFNVNSPVPAGDRNIMIRLFVRPGGGPHSYRVTLMAMQGRAYWSATIERPTGMDPNYMGIADDTPHSEAPVADRQTADYPRYESLLADTRELAGRLSQTLQVGGERR